VGKTHCLHASQKTRPDGYSAYAGGAFSRSGVGTAPTVGCCNTVARLGRTDVLAIDDWAMAPGSEPDGRATSGTKTSF
jgi:hypothetical protein